MPSLIRPLLLAAALVSAASLPAEEVALRLLQTSDVHGNFFPYDFITRRPASGSLARVASAVAAVRAEAGADAVVLLDNGDILQGQPTAYYYNYVDTASTHLAALMLARMGYDAATIGNHDVETGRRVMDRYASQLPCPMLGANVVNVATGEPHFRPYTVVERRGVRVAILGMITPAIPAWLPEALWQGLRFDDMEATARKWVAIIQEREHPDAIVGLFHAGSAGNVLVGRQENASLMVAQRVEGFDAVMMGHDHRVALSWVVNVAGDSVLVVNPANNAVNLADVALTFTLDSLGRVVGKRAAGRIVATDDYAPDSALLAEFAPQMRAVKEYVAAPVATMATAITTRDAYFGPSAFVDLIHQLQLQITGAEVSMAAPLSYDATIPAGPITMADMFNLYKYENLLYVMDLTGEEIRGYLEMSYSRWVAQMATPQDRLLLFSGGGANSGDQSHSKLRHPSYNFDSAAGIIYEVDVTKPAGQRVAIKGMADGTPFDPARHYRVAVNSYRGNGGGELLTQGAGIAHADLPSRIVSATDRDLRHYLAAHLARLGRVDPKPLGHWRFVPDSLVGPAARRDRALLFPQ